MAAGSGGTYDMTGEVVRGSIQHNGNEGISFMVTDRKGSSAELPVTYKGAVPDPFRGGREIVLTGSLKGGTFVGEPESLITKCPSKFTTQSNG
jgi:cytochrome c-type biogenesis protein CcmE